MFHAIGSRKTQTTGGYAMSKKIKQVLLKRELKRLLKIVKKHAGLILLLLAPIIVLIILHHLKKKAKKKIKKAVRAKVKQGIDNRLHGADDGISMVDDTELPENDDNID